MRTLPIRDLRTRANDDGSLTITGVAVPYGTRVEYGGVAEWFAPDAFDAAAAVDKPLLWSHQRDEPVGHITQASNDPDGLYIEALVQPTTRGRDAITLLRGGSLNGLSIGFEPVEWTNEDGGYRYDKARLHELSLTPMPAYEEARVTATRDQEVTMADQPTSEATVDLAPIHERLDQIEARVLASPPPVHPHAYGQRP